MENIPQGVEHLKTNDLIFLELVRRGYEERDGTHVWNIADSKLWYLSPEQAEKYLEMTHAPQYQAAVVEKEKEVLNQLLPGLVQRLPQKTYNLLDLGCGDGQKAALFIAALSEKIELRYCPIDISSYMVQTAADTIRTKGLVDKVLEFKWNVSDFENLNNVTPLFREGKFENHLLMLLGNTLGNFDIQEILQGMSGSMKPGDILVIGNGVMEEGADIATTVAAYQSESIGDWLSIVPKSIGLSEKDIEFSTRFRNSRIEEVYTLKKDVTLKNLGHSIELKKGDELLVAVSTKYTPTILKAEIEKYFPGAIVSLSDDKTYAVVVCEAK